MILYDFRCEQCDHMWEEKIPMYEFAPECVKCGSNFTHKIHTKLNTVKQYEAYDALDRTIPDTKKIKSFANDRRKGGKG